MALRTRTVKTLLAPLALTLLTGAAFAGPLTPTAGPVTSTMKTMTEVEPRIAISATNTPGDADSLFKITQPGSYYLTGNITGVSGKHGIEIAASGVTIDLKGFSLVGVPGSLDAVNSSLGPKHNVTIRDGNIASWGSDGIDVLTVVGGRIEGVSVQMCDDGIATGRLFVITNCVVNDNSALGIDTGTTSVVNACSASGNLIGIVTAEGGVVTNCSAEGNSRQGILVDSGTTVQGCSVRQNGIDGIACSSACLILNNVAYANGSLTTNGAGIWASGSDNRIEGNTCSAADYGVQVTSSGNVIIRNTCSGNTVNWGIASGNHYGPIVDRTIVAAPPAVNGNSAGEALGSSHPNANFTY